MHDATQQQRRPIPREPESVDVFSLHPTPWTTYGKLDGILTDSTGAVVGQALMPNLSGTPQRLREAQAVAELIAEAVNSLRPLRRVVLEVLDLLDGAAMSRAVATMTQTELRRVDTLRIECRNLVARMEGRP